MNATAAVGAREKRAAAIDELVGEIRQFLAANGDPAIVAKYGRYFTEGYDAYGVPDDVLRAKRGEWLERYGPAFGLEGFLDVSDVLWSSGKYEEGRLAIYFPLQYKAEFRPETLERIARWFEVGVRNWAHTDTLCYDLTGEFLTRGIVPLEAFGPWRESPHKFQRRAVPVSMLPLLKRKKDFGPLLDFLRPLMMDGEKVVRQGLGWFLREAWKKQPGPVEAFLLEWKDTAPRLIFQYATEKMTPENKERFRRAK
ncbi:MAG TPA: DNA alkylation repair protein [Chloroflexia bacterium]|nr:DNA alkylation repair protein [Chloroflexia bacterium]